MDMIGRAHEHYTEHTMLPCIYTYYPTVPRFVFNVFESKVGLAFLYLSQEFDLAFRNCYRYDHITTVVQVLILIEG